MSAENLVSFDIPEEDIKKSTGRIKDCHRHPAEVLNRTLPRSASHDAQDGRRFRTFCDKGLGLCQIQSTVSSSCTERGRNGQGLESDQPIGSHPSHH